MPSCVFLPLDMNDEEQIASEAFSVLTNSIEAEVFGIASALDMAIQYFITLDSTDHLEKVFILTDCQAAIDSVVNRREADGAFQVLARIRHHLISLRDLEVSVVLVSIPGHADIHYNDLADRTAKQDRSTTNLYTVVQKKRANFGGL